MATKSFPTTNLSFFVGHKGATFALDLEEEKGFYYSPDGNVFYPLSYSNLMSNAFTFILNFTDPISGDPKMLTKSGNIVTCNNANHVRAEAPRKFNVVTSSNGAVELAFVLSGLATDNHWLVILASDPTNSSSYEVYSGPSAALIPVQYSVKPSKDDAVALLTAYGELLIVLDKNGSLAFATLRDTRLKQNDPAMFEYEEKDGFISLALK